MYSESIGVLAGARISVRIAKDSKGQIAGFIKVELGIGFGGAILK